MSVRITEDDFDIALEHEKLKSRDAGAIVTFTGTVNGVLPFNFNNIGISIFHV